MRPESSDYGLTILKTAMPGTEAVAQGSSCAGSADQAVPQQPRALEIEEISHRYGNVLALDRVSFSVGREETICLLGHSGCGKTTLLRIIAGIERPFAGTVRLNGRPLTGPGVFVLPERRNIGFMFQDYALFPHLTVAANVAFGLHAWNAGDRRKAVAEALQRVGMSRHADAYPHTLSGGEQQRVALARALAPAPAVLLMDEPYSNLDQRLREGVREETTRILRRSGTSVLMVTHDPVEALSVADRIVLMHAGAIVQSGTPKELYCNPSSLFAARFFCDFNEIEGTACAGLVETPLGRLQPLNDIADGPCLVCIRPQSLAISPAAANSANAIVKETRFLGEATQVVLSVNGTDYRLRARAAPDFDAKSETAMRISVDPAGVFAYPLPSGRDAPHT